MGLMNDKIIETVRIQLLRRKITQGALAEKVGIHEQQLSRLLNGTSKGSVQAWERIAEVLGLELVMTEKQ